MTAALPYMILQAAANLKTLLTNKQQYMVGKIQIPSIPLCDGAVYISGDSMYPILKSGDIVGFKEINSFSNLIYGEMYLVSFTIEGDEYLAVKYVNRSEKEGYLKAGKLTTLITTQWISPSAPSTQWQS